MPRPRINDSLGVSDQPNVVSDLGRQAVVVAEMKARWGYIYGSYAQVIAQLDLCLSFNESLSRIERALNGKPVKEPRRRLHYEIELVLDHLAQQNAQARGASPGEALIELDIEAGARELLVRLKPRRGRPADVALRYHVEALMAVVQEALGMPAMAQLDRNGVYAPQATNTAGECVVQLAQKMQHGATTTQIVGIMKKARRRFANKPMRFLDLFPTYRARVDPETGGVIARPGVTIEVAWAPPIYVR